MLSALRLLSWQRFNFYSLTDKKKKKGLHTLQIQTCWWHESQPETATKRTATDRGCRRAPTPEESQRTKPGTPLMVEIKPRCLKTRRICNFVHCNVLKRAFHLVVIGDFPSLKGSSDAHSCPDLIFVFEFFDSRWCDFSCTNYVWSSILYQMVVSNCSQYRSFDRKQQPLAPLLRLPHWWF